MLDSAHCLGLSSLPRCFLQPNTRQVYLVFSASSAYVAVKERARAGEGPFVLSRRRGRRMLPVNWLRVASRHTGTALPVESQYRTCSVNAQSHHSCWTKANRFPSRSRCLELYFSSFAHRDGRRSALFLLFNSLALLVLDHCLTSPRAEEDRYLSVIFCSALPPLSDSLRPTRSESLPTRHVICA